MTADAQRSIQADRSTILRAALGGRFRVFRRPRQWMSEAELATDAPEVPLSEVRIGDGQTLEVRFEDAEPRSLVREAYASDPEMPLVPRSSDVRKGPDPVIETLPVEELVDWLVTALEVRDHLDGTLKYLYGGIHYMVGGGTDSRFWSLVINFLQTGNALPLSTTTAAAEIVKSSDWAALNNEWTAVLRAAQQDAHKVMCMWHHKPSGCRVRRCPFVHSSTPPLPLKDLKRRDRAALGGQEGACPAPVPCCANCGAAKAQGGGELKRCAQCKNLDAMYCSKACQAAHWKGGHKAICKRRVTQSQEPTRRGLTIMSDATGCGAVALMDNPGGESRLTLMSGDLGGGPASSSQDFVFRAIKELPPELQLLLSCGFKPNLHIVKKLAPQFNLNTLRLSGAGFTALEWASRKGHEDIARWLCQEGGADAAVGTPVLWAAYTNKVHLARMLVEFGADPRKEDPAYGMAAIHIAAENGSMDALRWLVEEQGVHPEARCRRGMTAAQHANAASTPEAAAKVCRYLGAMASRCPLGS